MLRAEDVKEEFLLCPICTKEFDEEIHTPRVLPCLHTFCQACMRKILKQNLLVCPFCKVEYALPSDGIYVFPKDSTRRNLIEFLRVRKRSSDILCKDCPDDNVAEDFCRECCIFMCTECTRAHKRSLASRGHITMNIQQLQSSGPEVFQRKQKCTKPGHEGHPLMFYCTRKGCDQLVCTACTVCDHDKAKGHNIVNVKDIHRQKTAELKKIFKMLEDEVNTAKLISQQTDQELLNIDIKEYEIEKEIEDVFEMCQKALDLRKQELKSKLAALCENKKSAMQHRARTLETFVDDVTSAKEFGDSIVHHTDPTEFIPLHLTLYRRLKMLTSQKIKKTFQVESPVFDPARMDDEYQRLVRSMGQLSTTVHTRKLNFRRGRTDMGTSGAPTPSVEGDVRIGDIFCPAFLFDSDTVHQYRELSDDFRSLKNQTMGHTVQLPYSERRLKKYRGAIGSRPFPQPGKHYFEVNVGFQIHKQLDNVNFLFEIGLINRRSDIDQGHYVYDHSNAWSFCAQHCEEHMQLCQWCRHGGRNHAHTPLSSIDAGTVVDVTYGFLVDTDQRKLTIVDCTNQKKLHTFSNLDVARPLWPVFGCHWPSKIKIEMILRTGSDIINIPALLVTQQ
ncbi:E3 ubiquitin-protein ligase TRIM56-like [Saccostrea echinata]|uniref:E3 ubiquitin-protein ligase TRIM56-like n=1 Tax=Saccostrea echinata TaxID=191078 RepID=UPI002A83DB55|nr:E3 ubiquitin-protein ligase TRIM56-like [Saccostrea echinata]